MVYMNPDVRYAIRITPETLPLIRKLINNLYVAAMFDQIEADQNWNDYAIIRLNNPHPRREDIIRLDHKAFRLTYPDADPNDDMQIVYTNSFI